MAKVHPSGALGDGQLGSDLAVRQTERYQRRHLQLAPGEDRPRTPPNLSGSPFATGDFDRPAEAQGSS